MKINKPIKILIGVATIWFAFYPLLFFFIWLAVPLSMFLADSINTRYGGIFPAGLFLVIIPVHCLTIFIMLGLQVFYLIHVIKNDQALEVLRITLGVGNFYFPFIAMPVYFLIFIWPENPPAWALVPTPPGINLSEPTQGVQIAL